MLREELQEEGEKRRLQSILLSFMQIESNVN